MLRTHPGRSLLLSCALLIGCSLSVPTGAQQSSSSVQEHFLAAQRDQQQGLLDQAVHEYESVLRLEPGLVEAHINLGLIYYAQGRFEESAAALTTAGKLKPGMRGVSLWLGIDDVKLHRPERGAALLRAAIRQDPTDKLAQSWLATALWDAGQMDAALLQLGKASAQFPNDPDLLFARGEAYGKAAAQQTEQLLEKSAGTALSDLIYGTHYADEREWTEAEGHLRRAIERDPHLLAARLEFAQTLLDQDRIPAAEEQLDQALSLAPQSPSALARSGELLLLTQRQAEGLSRIERAIAIDPNEALDALGLPVEDRFDRVDHSGADARLPAMSRKAAEILEANPTASPAKDASLAALYELAGDGTAARRAFGRIKAAQSNLSTTAKLHTQATTAMHQHRYDDAEPLFLRWLAANPGDRAASYELIQVRRHISTAQIIRLLTVAPDSYHVHQLLGQLYVSREEDDEALTEYLAVAAARPDLPGVHFWLGHLYWKHGDADHALTELTRELELSPGHPEANAELGTVLVAQERAGEAIPHLESAIHSKPDLWPAYAQLGRAYSIQKNYARAEEVLKRALDHDQDAMVHYQLGLVLRAEGKTTEAAHLFAEVRAIKSERMATADDATNQGAKQ